MTRLHTWVVLVSLPLTLTQQIGAIHEAHPQLITHKCTKEHGCLPQNTSIVLDAQWRDLDDVRTGTSCLTSDAGLNKTICPTAEECASNCALSGLSIADYEGSGVHVHYESVTLHMYKKFQGKTVAVGPQIYLFGNKDYRLMKLLNQEISFEVDVSKLPCGMNGAMYMAAMDANGGRSKLNPAGAAYGTGYCDSQCYDYNFINGVANLDKSGACCNEMDLLETNSRAAQFTCHPCNLTGVYACTGKECDGGKYGVCDNTGCGFNPYGLGVHDYYGFHSVVDTSEPFRVVTQFVTDESGDLAEIRRLYLQNGNVIHNAAVTLDRESYDSISSAYCHDFRAKSFHNHGGLKQIGEALKRGMVLIMGIWNEEDNLNWLDAGSAGPCNRKEGSPHLIQKKHPGTQVTFSHIRWGDIGSTY